MSKFIEINNTDKIKCSICSSLNENFTRYISAIIVDDFDNKFGDSAYVSIKKCKYCPICGSLLKRGDGSG